MTLIAKHLNSFKFFEGISEQARETLSTVCLLKEYKKKDYLFHEGDQGTGIYLLIEGNIQLHKTSFDGKETVIKVVKEKEVFAEVVLFEAEEYPVTALVLTPSKVIYIPKTEIHQLLEQADFRRDFISMLMKKQRYLTERISYLSSYDVEDRFRMFLKEHFGVTNTIQCNFSKKDMALAIGTTAESLSRLLLSLKERNLLFWETNQIKASKAFWEKEL